MSDYIEWFFLPEEALFDPENELIESIKLEYSQEFVIQIEVRCRIPPQEGTRGLMQRVFLPEKPLIACSREFLARKYKITGISIHENTMHNLENVVIFKGSAHQVEKYYEGDIVGPTDFEIYWFLNSATNLGYTSVLKADSEGRQTFNWGDFDTDTYETSGIDRTSRSLISLRYKEIDLLFGRVHEGTQKKASFLRTKRGTKMELSEVYELELLLSYVLGTEIILVGRSAFNKASSPCSILYLTNYSQGMEKIYNQPELAVLPIRMNDLFTGYSDPTRMINEFFVAYGRAREQYSLDKVIWLLSYARTQHPLTKMHPLSTAFDLLCNGHFKGQGNTIVAKTEFSAILEKILEVIRNAVVEDKKRISLEKHAGNINNNSINQRNKLVFDQLQMNLSKLETDSLEARNSSVHGNRSQIDYVVLMRNNNAYMMLINRLLIRILGLTHYVDYSVQGLAVNPVLSPQAGEFDVRRTNF